ncbi:sensor histidine kinase [Labedaea rhizosphaerae]|uniref:histidine kinase n=1 Tax=Labedaea rhizosphaerae TaxID=598644 RepID=A0A4R6SAZ0_LABRH|nr:nitrate- and nitrite sensing domain-containing protein [Labedaea rhizosphaerae]TDP97100.1 signal transduction histidine kinase [Labedaea rhizosphaerae]
MTEPARKTTGSGIGRTLRSVWSALTRWRDWTLPVKLTAITVVPLVFAIVLGVVVIANQVSAADSYKRVDRLVATGDQVRKLTTWLQRERTESATLLANGSENRQSQLLGDYHTTDTAARGMFAAVDKSTFGTDATADRYSDVRTALAGLPKIRDAVVRGSVGPASSVSRYSSVIKTLLSFDAALSEEVVDPRLAGTAGALHDLEAAKEEIYLQQALLGAGIIRGTLPQSDTASIAASQARLADRVQDFRSKADPDQQAAYDKVVSGTVVKQRQQLADRVATGATSPSHIGITDWNNASELTVGRMTTVSAQLGRQLQATSSRLQDEASDGAGTASVLLLLALLLAVGAMVMVAKHLLSSLGVLRRSAFQVAEKDLPAAVASIRDGAAAPPEITPVAVHTKDEVGQVARAFDAVHSQALRLAAEQATLRANYGSVFVNLSRRSQGLVQRQLQLLERLERDEEDADQLATLFQLDHLATRMRRNNENLMVLSGSDLTRRSSQPVPLADLLRAAVSEIEQYQRVLIQAPVDAVVVGYAASDLVRLIAELLDNATAFSAPETQVTIASRLTDDGSVGVDVLDHGIGMTDEEVVDANRRLSQPGSVDVSASRRMGLFVIGRLASRHGVLVRLNGGTNIAGLRAAVVVPHELVTRKQRGDDQQHRTEPVPTRPSPRPRTTDGLVNGSTNGSTVNGTNHGTNNGTNNGSGNNGTKSGTNGSSLPQRAHTNGANGSEIAKRLRGEAELPLPRRASGSDGAEQPTTAPNGRSTEDTDLFAAATDASWWETGASRPTTPDPSETTPIFDAMVSAWFRAETDADVARHTQADQTEPAEKTDETDQAEQAEQAWSFAADDGWHTAEAVSTAEPSAYTDNGLPRRTPREKLVPGSVDGGANGHKPEPGGLSAHELRTRLSRLQEGLARGREPEHGAAPAGRAVGARSGHWRFVADDGFAAAERVSEYTNENTDVGLPQRNPRERLVPGSVGGRAGADLAATQWSRQDAEELRGRLGSFQRGVTKGRRSLADQPTGSGAFDNHDETGE